MRVHNPDRSALRIVPVLFSTLQRESDMSDCNEARGVYERQDSLSDCLFCLLRFYHRARMVFDCRGWQMVSGL